MAGPDADPDADSVPNTDADSGPDTDADSVPNTDANSGPGGGATDGWSASPVTTSADWDDAVDLRMAVFVDEQGVPEALELDEHDEAPLDSEVDHLLVRDGDGDAVAVARLRAVDADAHWTPAGDGESVDADRVAKVERVAVARERRGEGWGRRAMCALEERARARGLPAVVLHAQTRAAGFYRRSGYERDDDRGTFEEDGIEHVRMRRRL